MLGGSLEHQDSEEDGKRYCFVVDWYDAVASLTRRYQFLYYPKDKSVEMVSIIKSNEFIGEKTEFMDKRNRNKPTTLCNSWCGGGGGRETVDVDILFTFSFYPCNPNSKYPVTDGYLACNVKSSAFNGWLESKLFDQTCLHLSKIFSDIFLVTRHFFLFSFSFSFRTLGLLNSKAVPKMGEMLEFIQNKGLKITKMKMCVLTRAEAAEFCVGYKDKEFYLKLIDNMTSGPVVALELLGDDAICAWLRAIGPENAEEAVASAPLTVASQFGEANLCYGPRCAGEAAQQLEFFFPTSGGIIRRNSVVLEDCTCCVVKPHAVLSGLAPKIIKAITDAGFEITAIQMFHLERVCAEEFLEVYKGVVPEYPSMVTELTSGPCVAIALRAKDAPKAFREMTGPADPEIARHLRPRSLRALFGIDKIKNAVHCTDLPEDGILEVEYFFKILDR
ncbi:nucleoside diphosphate kinase 7 [Octopus bimaculoides]|uniref:nucleoside diphosphate kinase 7 n=1 Tax=Octopus bimaculoides TaxID=37653 RepID=UPI00071E4DBC|nr:nucleoside diphosphate kinase 7 [Octopus bimaculoides]|eukprot:XP_014779666.1 PREDICTED: nucleoside diphosphate kinase 7-like [Octopus bimaculoides]